MNICFWQKSLIIWSSYFQKKKKKAYSENKYSAKSGLFPLVCTTVFHVLWTLNFFREDGSLLCISLPPDTKGDWCWLDPIARENYRHHKKKKKKKTDALKKMESIWLQGLVPKTRSCCKMEPNPTLTLTSHTAWTQLAVKNTFLKDFLSYCI